MKEQTELYKYLSNKAKVTTFAIGLGLAATAGVQEANANVLKTPEQSVDAQYGYGYDGGYYQAYNQYLQSYSNYACSVNPSYCNNPSYTNSYNRGQSYNSERERNLTVVDQYYNPVTNGTRWVINQYGAREQRSGYQNTTTTNTWTPSRSNWPIYDYFPSQPYQQNYSPYQYYR